MTQKRFIIQDGENYEVSPNSTTGSTSGSAVIAYDDQSETIIATNLKVTGSLSGSDAKFTGDIVVNGTASIGQLNTISSNEVLIGDKFIVILSGTSDRADLDGAGIMWGSGSTQSPTGSRGEHGHITYNADKDRLDVYPGMSASFFSGSFYGDATGLSNISSSQIVDFSSSISNAFSGGIEVVYVTASFSGNGANLTNLDVVTSIAINFDEYPTGSFITSSQDPRAAGSKDFWNTSYGCVSANIVNQVTGSYVTPFGYRGGRAIRLDHVGGTSNDGNITHFLTPRLQKSAGRQGVELNSGSYIGGDAFRVSFNFRTVSETPVTLSNMTVELWGKNRMSWLGIYEGSTWESGVDGLLRIAYTGFPVGGYDYNQQNSYQDDFAGVDLNWGEWYKVEQTYYVLQNQGKNIVVTKLYNMYGVPLWENIASDWENYYLYDFEQTSNGNLASAVDSVQFKLTDSPDGQHFFIDQIEYSVFSATKFLSPNQTLTGSFSGSLTGSASHSLSGSYALSSSHAITANNAFSSSYALSGGYSINSGHATSASYALSSSRAVTASYSISSSLTTSSSYSLSSSYAVSASYSLSGSQATSASYALSSSYAVTAAYAAIISDLITASYAANAISASYSLSSSFANTSSYAVNAGLLGGQDSSYYARTGSNTFQGKQTISASSNAVTIYQDSALTAGTLSTYPLIIRQSGSGGFSFGASGGATNRIEAVSGSGVIGGNILINSQGGGDVFLPSSNTQLTLGSSTNPDLTSKIVIYASSSTTNALYAVTGSVTLANGGVSASAGFTGSLSGTASYASNAATASVLAGFTPLAYAITGANTFAGNQIISGNLTASNVNVSGGLTVGDYVQLLPVAATGIPTNLSASYIYTSGSTNDLYFTQYQGDYTNTTRLRWLESALNTGLLHGGVLSTTNGTTTFNVSSGSGLIVTYNASTSSDPYPTINFVNWAATSSIPLTYSGSAQITYVSIDLNGHVAQRTTPPTINDFKTSIILGRILHQSGSVTNGSITAPATAYGVNSNTSDFIRAIGPLKTSGHFLAASGSTLQLTKSAGDSYVEGRNYTLDPQNPNYITANNDAALTVSKIYRQHVSASKPVINSGVAGAGYTAVDPTLYQLADGSLASVGTDFTVQRVYWFPRSVNRALFVYYGQAKYANLDDAIAAISTENFAEGENTLGAAILIGYLVMKGNISNFNTASTARIYQAGVFRGGTGVGGGGGGGGGGATNLASLTDVTLGSPSEGEAIVYDISLGKWVDGIPSTSSYALTSSVAISSSYALSSSEATSASYSLSGSQAVSSSYTLSASYSVSSSYATSASYAATSSQAATASYITSSGISGPISAANGGTGLTSFISGALYIAGTTDSLSAFTGSNMNVVGWDPIANRWISTEPYPKVTYTVSAGVFAVGNVVSLSGSLVLADKTDLKKSNAIGVVVYSSGTKAIVQTGGEVFITSASLYTSVGDDVWVGTAGSAINYNSIGSGNYATRIGYINRSGGYVVLQINPAYKLA